MFTIIYKLLLNNLAQIVAANEERARRVRLTRETRNTAMRPRAKNPAASRCQLLPLSTSAPPPLCLALACGSLDFFRPRLPKSENANGERPKPKPKQKQSGENCKHKAKWQKAADQAKKRIL